MSEADRLDEPVPPEVRMGHFHLYIANLNETRRFYHELLGFDDIGPTQQQLGAFTLWRDGRISILCGDYFALTTNELGMIDTVYDRSALTALPEEIRGLYVAQLSRLVGEPVVDDRAQVLQLLQVQRVITET